MWRKTWVRLTLGTGSFLLAALLPAVTDRPLKSATVPLKPSARSDRIVFVVGGDNRPTGKGAPVPRVEGRILSEIHLIAPDFVLWTGDSIYGYGDTPEELAREYAGILVRLRHTGVPVFNAPGNHEIHQTEKTLCTDHSTEKAFEHSFGPLYGSFDYGGYHFIALDSAVLCRPDEIAGEQLDWLKKDLEINKDARGIFIFDHTEFFSPDNMDPDAAPDHPEMKNAAALESLFEKYRVKAVFSGHEHLFYRIKHDGIEYFVSGGGGAPLYATADRGGFSEYLLVAIDDGQVTYDVVEPGRFYVERAARHGPQERRFWVVNSTDSMLPARNIAVSVSARLGPCARLAVRSDLHKSNGTPVPVPVSIASCQPAGQALRLRLEMTAPRRASIPIVVTRKK